MSKHRVIAINLPQFHPFPENDEWWGKGFTEWTNVTKAKPRFKGHYQPHLPTETGFYDLRLPESRQMQADMAREAGIYGFCYYHYWFNGHQLMERPVNDILKSGEPDFPFMLCWANENWSRTWDGSNREVLIKQEYSKEDDIAHMRWLCENVFPDRRYIRVDGRPFIIIYNPGTMKDVAETIKTWRDVASLYNMELYVGFMRCWSKDFKMMMSCGFDVHVDFLPRFENYHPLEYYSGKYSRLWYKIKQILRSKVLHREEFITQRLQDYQELIDEQIPSNEKPYKEYPCVTPSWDNSPRRVNNVFWALINNTPDLYGKWLRQVLKTFVPFTSEENFVFINAWNEWAEGNHLEPDMKWGRAYLDATKEAIKQSEDEI